MAKIKLRFEANEIEIDSRDFYLDNQTIGTVIDDLSGHMSKNAARTGRERGLIAEPVAEPPDNGLGILEDAEVFEPEFSEPKPVEAEDVRARLKTLEESRFFDTPRTVSEAVQQLREIGWIASSLDVSMALAKMASSREIAKNCENDRMYYSTPGCLVAA